jgi:hypothetical protein
MIAVPTVGCYRGAAFATLTNRRMTMKTMFLTLAAVLGFAIGTASLIPAAHASRVYLHQPTDNGQG